MDFDRLRKRWESYLLGEGFDENTESGKRVVASLNRIVEEGVGYLPTESPSAVSPYFTLRALAMAYRVKGTRYYGNEKVRDYILSQLEQLYETEYNLNTPDDNFWVMEIGLPLRIEDILILLYEELPDRENLIRKYTDVILKFRDAYQKSSHGREETGANMVWKCHSLILTGILRREEEWIRLANENLEKVFYYGKLTEVPGFGKLLEDGFYKDGSFIQHYCVGYTGGYGKHLINILSGIVYTFHGTEALTLSEEKLDFFYERIFDSYEPLIYQGRFMDIARGREPSRSFYEDRIAGRHVMRAICYFTKVMPKEKAQRARRMLKEWLSYEEDWRVLFEDESGCAEYFIHPSLVPVAEELMEGDTPKRGALEGLHMFGAMAKAVYLTKGYGASVSMYNSVIACYERLNTESEKFWHFSDGTTYVYLEQDADNYNGDWYATVDMQRLPGITVDRDPDRYKAPYYSWYQKESRNVFDFAGGCSVDKKAGIVGFHYLGQGKEKERSLDVRKSWFFWEEGMLCMGSDISSGTEDEIETVVDNRRILKDASNTISIDGKEPVSAKELEKQGVVCLENVRTIHLSGNRTKEAGIGYYFPDKGRVELLCEHRKGTWNQVEIDPKHIRENDFMTLYIPHGRKPQKGEYAYVVLPGASREKTAQYEKEPAVTILERSAKAHAMKHEKEQMFGIVFWEEEAYESCGVRCSTQACVFMKKTEAGWHISVFNPTTSDRTIELTFPFGASSYTIRGGKEKERTIFCIQEERLRLELHTGTCVDGAVELMVETK